MKTIFVSDLNNGDVLTQEQFGVVAVRQATDKNGNAYLDMELLDNTGAIKAKVWGNTLASMGQVDFEAGDVVEIVASVGEFRGALQLTIQEMTKVSKGDYDLQDFLLTTEKDIKVLARELKGFISQVEDREIKALLEGLIKKYKTEYFRAPAAKTNHHHYLGGLVEHVVEMLKLAAPLKEIYPEANFDLIIAGIILHDIGKIKELDVKGFAINYTKKGNLIGHISLALKLVNEYLWENKKKFQDLIDSEKLMLIEHIILAHHGVLEFGSPVVPKIIEAEVVSKIDDLSSKVRVFQKILQSNKDSEQDFSDRDFALGTNVYLRSDQAFSHQKRGQSAKNTGQEEVENNQKDGDYSQKNLFTSK